jgi:hypothetical protein
LYIVHRTSRPAFTLVEAAISMVLVAVLFAAGMSAAGVAARDRKTQNDIRTGSQLARTLMDEIVQQRYVDPAANTIAPAPGVSTTDRSNWTHISDYNGLAESPPRGRDGAAITGTTGWRWTASVAYTSYPSFAGQTGTAPSGGLVGGLLGAVTNVVTAVLGAAATDTGLKQITVTVYSPTGVPTTLTCFRSSKGAVDRVSTGTGFQSGASLTLTVGGSGKSVQVSAPLLNTPASP